MKYLITKLVNDKFRYYLQEIKRGDRTEAVWNGIKDNAKLFDREHLAHAYMLTKRIRDAETKLENHKY